jgi:outer membrane protein TolC
MNIPFAGAPALARPTLDAASLSHPSSGKRGIAAHTLCLAVVAVLGAGSSWGQTGSPLPELSLDAALRLAETRSSALQAQDSAAGAAREMAAAAGTLPDPALKLGINNLPVEGPDAYSLTDDFMTMRSVGLMQEFTRADKRKARAARFEREADVADADRRMQLVELRRETANAWLDRYFQQQMLDLLQAQRQEANLAVEATDIAYRTTKGTQADLFMARTAVARIDDQIRQAQAEADNASTMLARWVGDAGTAPLAGAPDITHTRVQAQTLTHQLDAHPDLAVMQAREAAALADAEVARRDKQADWSVELMYSQRGPAYSNMMSLNVSVPLQWNQSGRQDRELAAKLALAEQLRAEREELRREHDAQTRQWLVTWQSQLARLSDYDQSLIPLAAERTRATLTAYRTGSGPLTDVLDARRMEIDTRMERLRIEREAAELWTSLEYLIPDDPAAGAQAGLQPASHAQEQ